MADTIKEFLATLGFHVDEPSYRKFNEALALVSKRAADMSELLIGAAGGIAAAVTKVAGTYTDLERTKDITGAAVRNLQSLEAAFNRLKIPAETARGLVVGFADALSQPGKAGLLDQLGVAAGDPAERLLGLIKKLQERFPGEGQRFVRQNYAELFGIDHQSLRVIEENFGKLQGFITEFNKKQDAAGDRGNEAAKKFDKFWQSLTNMEQAFERLGRRIATSFIDPVQKAIDKITEATDAFSKFNEDHGGTPGVAGAVATGVLGTATVKWLFGKLGKMLGRVTPGQIEAAGEEAAAAAPEVAAKVWPKLLGKMMGVIGMLLLDSDPAEGGPELVKRNPKTGALEPTPEARDMMKQFPKPHGPRWYRGYPDPDATAFGDRFKGTALGDDGSPGAPVINQKTEITVAPGQGAEDTARAVGKIQDRVNGDLVRNMKGALQ